MARIMVMKVLCFMAVCIVVVTPYTEALNCGDLMMDMAPCIVYLQDGGEVSNLCCKGVRKLHSAKTSREKRMACACMKDSYRTYSPINSRYAASLPKKCGVKLPFKLSANMDCNKVK